MLEWWGVTSGDLLAQGDFLPNCQVPVLPVDYGERPDFGIDLELIDAIIMTQSCDLAHAKIEAVTLCAVYSIPHLQLTSPNYAVLKNLEEVRRGNIPSLHLLSGLDGPADRLAALVVDFRRIHSLPIGYLRRHAVGLGERKRLLSPYVEHLSQAFARFFMRVGLPSDLPSYR